MSLVAAAIVVAPAHPDHAEGLWDGALCPVYATQASWKFMRGYAVADWREVTPREPFEVGSIRLAAFPVIHSTRAPAVSCRISAGRLTVFCDPDLVYIDDRSAAVSGWTMHFEVPWLPPQSGALSGEEKGARFHSSDAEIELKVVRRMRCRWIRLEGLGC
jgi:hypothetical protein